MPPPPDSPAPPASATDPAPAAEPIGFSSRIVALFLDGPLPLLIIIATLLAGAVALWLTPREEEPQIVVPLADVLVRAPGLSARQIERQVTTPLEKLLYQIDGVEYVYSMSRENEAIVTVRFFVGEDREDSLVKIYNKMHSNLDLVPSQVESWLVKPVEIDDVPIVVATLWSDDPARVDDHRLRRLAEELAIDLQSVPRTNRVSVVGGRPRIIQVELLPDALAARRTTPLEVAWALGMHNAELPAGGIDRANTRISIQVGEFIPSVDALRSLVVGVVDGIPVYLRDVARIVDGPEPPSTYTWIGFGPAAEHAGELQMVPSPPLPPAAAIADSYPAVSLAIAKQRGANAVWVARDVERRLAAAAATLFPPSVHWTVTRDYGLTANEKVNELVEGLAVAVLTVVIFIGLVLGWRAALVIALAVPVCYGATLLVNLLAGYTINRVTLFALILALGILVDDPITDVENIERYYRMRRFSPRRAILLAVQEIRPALVLSTIAVMLSFVPMFFITGMMGPYMRPMALNVPITIGMSLLVAFCVTPYLSRLILRPHGKAEEAAYDIRRTIIYRLYNFLLRPLLRSRLLAWLFLLFIGALFLISVALPALRLVPLKMLPFDNKNEFQVLLDMPEGTTLERTDAVLRDLATVLRTVPEVTHFTAHAGHASPMDFNGMVRHYFLRSAPELGELRVGLMPKDLREQQSHALILRIRDALAAAAPAEASLKLVEVPPGPPVIATVTAEFYGEPWTPYERLQDAALAAAERLRKEQGVVDVDTSVETPRPRLRFDVDKEKAALSGVGTEDIAQTLALAVGGLDATILNLPSEAVPLPVRLRLPLTVRSDPSALAGLYVKGRAGIAKVREGIGIADAPQPLVPLGEIGAFTGGVAETTIYHKNLRPVAYLFADTAGRAPADVVLDAAADLGTTATASAEPRALAGRTYFNSGGGIPWELPTGTSVKWTGEGEWKITVDVFRDLGLAFGAAVVAIFFVLMLQTGSATLSAIMILAIPLTMIGIMPGFWLLNQVTGPAVGGYANPTFFTATAMIGMIALAGIVVRNSVILVEFVHQALREGMALDEALVQSGAIRTRPIFLTAGTTLLGNVVITLDPIFSGLAWSIIFGIAASTLFTLGVIPVVYNLVYARRPGHGLRAAREEDA